MGHEVISSTSNNRIKNVIKCVKSAKERRNQDVFVVEGLRMFSEIPADKIVDTYATEDFYKKNSELINEKVHGLNFVTEHVMEVMSDTKTPQGIISLVSGFHYDAASLIEIPENDAPVLIALDGLQDPGNLGTIIRTAEGAGVSGIVMSRETVDVYNPKVVRSTMGSIFRIPFCYVENLSDWLKKCEKNGMEVYGAHIEGENFYEYDYTKPTVFCIGNEGNGLSKEVVDVLDKKISIPMKGQVESLNAATAATVLMYEAMRQKSK